MKMGDGGFRPPYNVQFGSDDALVIVDVNVETVGSDAGLLEPMHTRVCEQYDATPKQWLADGGFSKKDGSHRWNVLAQSSLAQLPAKSRFLAKAVIRMNDRPATRTNMLPFVHE